MVEGFMCAAIESERRSGSMEALKSAAICHGPWRGARVRALEGALSHEQTDPAGSKITAKQAENSLDHLYHTSHLITESLFLIEH